MEETSLDDFVAADRATASEGKSERAEHGAETGEGASDVTIDDAPAPAEPDTEGGPPEQPTITAAWSDDADPCPACGEPATWRWAQEDAMVCPDCKEW